MYFAVLGFAGCVATHTSPVLRDLRDQSLTVLRHCDAEGGWEADIPAARPSGSSYRLPKTLLLTFVCNVRDPGTFLDRAELGFAHFVRARGVSAVDLDRNQSPRGHELTWIYVTAGREGVVTLWEVRRLTPIFQDPAGPRRH